MNKSTKRQIITFLEKSIKTLALFYFGILSPGIAFLGVGFVIPEYQTYARFGIFSFLGGAFYVFAPIVIFATLNFFIIFVLGHKKNIYKFQVISLWAGFVTATLALVAGFLGDNFGLHYILFFFTPIGAPLITPIIYFIAAKKAQKLWLDKKTKEPLIWGALLNIPFIPAAIIWAQDIYEKTPHKPMPGDGCFVVTAAQTANHPYINRINVQDQSISKQLVIIKAGEFLWERKYPKFHKLFRAGYNIIGPSIAKLIHKSQFLAIATHILLKPVEYLFLYILKLQKKI
jgi:hypothetical protein